MEKADSWSVDGHKTLNTPYDSGIVLCKHPQALSAAMQATGSYIIYSENRDGMLYTPEMSRRSRAIELWATLKSIGKSGVEELVDGLCERAQQCAQELSAQGFHILNEVVFNQVLVAADTPEQTAAVLKNVQQSGECWCGGARWRDTPVIRVSVCSWATTAEDIHRTVRAFVKGAPNVNSWVISGSVPPETTQKFTYSNPRGKLRTYPKNKEITFYIQKTIGFLNIKSGSS